MTEWMQGVLASLAWYAVGAYATLYWIGGRVGTSKSIRRFVGGLLLGCSTLLLAYANSTLSWWMLLGAFHLVAGLTMGYGGEPKSAQLTMRRIAYGLVVSSSSLWFAISLGSKLIEVAVFQIVLGTAASWFFGTRNPFDNAAKEEAVIGGLGVVLIPMIV